MPNSTTSQRSILVPIANPETADQLVSTAADFAADNDLTVQLLIVVRVPEQVPLSEGERLIDDEREILNYAVEVISDNDLDVAGRIRFARSISSGILSVIEELNVQMVLMGWRGRPRRRDIILGTHLDEVVQNAPCDVLVKRMNGSDRLQRILLPVAGGPNTELATSVASSLARVHEAEVHVISVHSPEETTRHRREKVAVLARVIGGLTGVPVITQEMIENESTVDVIVAQSSDCDLVVLGATSHGRFHRSLVGSIPEQIGRESVNPVIMAKQYRNLPTRLSRIVARYKKLRERVTETSSPLEY